MISHCSQGHFSARMLMYGFLCRPSSIRGTKSFGFSSSRGSKTMCFLALANSFGVLWEGFLGIQSYI